MLRRSPRDAQICSTLLEETSQSARLLSELPQDGAMNSSHAMGKSNIPLIRGSIAKGCPVLAARSQRDRPGGNSR